MSRASAMPGSAHSLLTSNSNWKNDSKAGWLSRSAVPMRGR